MIKPIQMLNNSSGLLTVLCDDGSIWYQFYNEESDRTEWVRDIGIPQDDEDIK